jgi:hypothetical protein
VPLAAGRFSRARGEIADVKDQGILGTCLAPCIRPEGRPI